MKAKSILWIEDDYYHLQFLTYLLEKEGYYIDVADSIYMAISKSLAWRTYDLIIMDLILPLTTNLEPIPEFIKSWNDSTYIGIELIKWLKNKLNVTCPILVLTIAKDPTAHLDIRELVNIHYLEKSGLEPITFKTEVLKILAQ